MVQVTACCKFCTVDFVICDQEVQHSGIAGDRVVPGFLIGIGGRSWSSFGFPGAPLGVATGFGSCGPKVATVVLCRII